MQFTNEFAVAAPADRVWETLLDIERVAAFLPGATIEPAGEDGVHRGSMRVKVGPMTVAYQGTARLRSVDEDARTAEIEVRAKEAKGQGTASAVIRNRLVAEDGRTRVIAETDLQVTGRQAQFGRGIMEDVAGSMLGQFAGRFERYLQEGDDSSPPAAGGGDTGADRGTGSGQRPTARETAHGPQASGAGSTTDEVLDMGAVLSQAPMVRYAAAIGAGLLAVAVVAAARRSRSRGLKVEFGYRL